MEKKFIGITLLIAIISSISYLFFIFIDYYNSQENIKKRCTSKFQKDVKKVEGVSEEEWGLSIDIANDNYFKCMKIP